MLMKTIIGITIAFILAVGMVGVGTWAYFSDTESSSGNTFQAWTSTQWVQTEKLDFEAGVLNNVDTSSSPGDVKLATIPPPTLVGNWSGETDFDTNGFNYTPGAGSNRVALVTITAESNSTPVANINQVTLGGQALTAIENADGVVVGSAGFWHDLIWFGYLNETGIGNMSGNALNITWDTTPTNSPPIMVQAATYQNVDQTTPIADSASNTNTAAGSIQAGSVSVGSNDRLVYVTVCGQPSDHTAPIGYTEQIEQDGGPVDSHSNASVQRDATTSSTENPTATWSGTNRLAIISAVLNAVGSAPPAWYNPGWLYRRPITIDHTQVEDVADPSTTYANFPVLVYATGLSNIKADGADIRFTSSDGITELPREIESYSGGTLYAWVKVTLTKDSNDADDDVIYMYYGNAAATEPAPGSAYGSQNVWDSNYTGVWHLSEDPSGAPPQMKDSTSNDNDSTSQGSMTAGDQVTGQIDGSLDLDGINDYIQTTSGESKTASNITWEVWFKADVTTGSHHILWQGPVSQNGWGEPGQAAAHEMHLTIGRMSTADRLVFFYGYEFSSDNFVPAVEIDIAFSDTSGWNYAVGVLTDAGTSPSGTLYLNGNSVGTDTGTETNRTSWDTDLRIGQCGADQRRLDGLVDEVRVSNIARSAEWIKTCYNNQYSPSTFCSVGSEQQMITYISSGTIASQVLDTGVTGARWDALFWDETLQSNTDITFEARASDTSFAKGDASPSWTSVGGTSPVTLGLPSGRYMQWRATLTTSDTSKTPILHEVRVYHY